MKNNEIIIVGAGLAGMISANFFRKSEIFEAGPKREAHKALLRFRGTGVSEITGIPFRKVTVHKGIWHDGKFNKPNIMLANMYSRKVTGKLMDRSIWNLEDCTRYIAPETFIQQMQDELDGRIHYSSPIDIRGVVGKRIISTAPISSMAKMAGIAIPEPEYGRIYTERWRIPGANVNQTIYFPGENTPIYRASITGDILIIEGVSQEFCGNDCMGAFGVSRKQCVFMDRGAQEFGKISPMDEIARRRTISRLTQEHGVYSLGRFATWRNILLDDIVNDLAAIKKLMEMDNYELSLKG